jgi:hypothetical protein
MSVNLDKSDLETIASLVGSNNGYFREKFGNRQTDSSLAESARRNLLDPRKVFGANINIPQQVNMQIPNNFNQPVQQHQGELDEYGIPKVLQPVQGFIPMPIDEKGNTVIPQGVANIPGITPIPAQQPLAVNEGFSMQNAQGFVFPTAPNTQNNTSNINADAILAKMEEQNEEIKKLKRAVNALTNLLKKTILVPALQPTETKDISDETSSK